MKKIDKNAYPIVRKLFFIYECIILLEEKQGKYVIIDSLEKMVTSKRRLNREVYGNIKISKKEFKKLFMLLVAEGVIFVPRGGFVQRLLTFKWKDVRRANKKYEKASNKTKS